jgi:acyl-CoA synthetase (AMP-forming)/AMP-acid ligase II
MERWNADDAVQAPGGWSAAPTWPARRRFSSRSSQPQRRAGTKLREPQAVRVRRRLRPAVFDPAMRRTISKRAAVTRVFGSTEVPVTTVGATRKNEADQAADTDGRAGVAEIKLVDHQSAPAGEGEIYCRGPQMLVGYLHPEDEAEAFDADGFFRTGDLARWVDGIYLVVTGRAKDIIIRNGENIAPKEIEDILVGHPESLKWRLSASPIPEPANVPAR